MQLLRRVVTVDWPKKVEADGKALLLRTARTGHAKIMSDAGVKGFVPTWEAYANRPGNANLESVVLPGPIVYNYRYISDLIQLALDELRKASPVQSGDYVSSHTLFVNGQAVDALPKTITADDQIMIANPVPYARKIEVGKTESGRPFVIQVAPRVYQRVFDILKAQSRGRAKITYGFVDLAGYSLKQTRARRRFTSAGIRRAGTHHAGSAVTSPAIFFRALI